MEVIEITFSEEGRISEQKLTVTFDMKLGEFREAAQTLLSLPDNLSCRLILERNKEELSDNATFRNSGIQQGDKLILIPPPRPQENKYFSHSSGVFLQVQEEISDLASSNSLVKYTLKLNLINDGNKPEKYDYPIELEEFYEDNPRRFFSDYGGKEYQKFKTALQEIESREVSNSEIDKILQEWCDDISLGYRDTTIEI